jgi:hypothetical protein
MATLKAPTAEALAPLYEALEEARQDCLDACENVTMDLDLGALSQAYGAWEKAAEAWNDAVEALATQVDEFISEHSEKWAQSAKGEAFNAWSDALRGASVETEPSDTLDLSITLNSMGCEIAVTNADSVLPETPENPGVGGVTPTGPRTKRPGISLRFVR